MAAGAGSPLISVVIPTFNRSGLLGRALAGALEQDADHEVLVVDDGSTDETEEVVAAVADDRIRYVRTTRQGRCAARNTGASLARGRYLAFLDSDDEALPGWLEAVQERARPDGPSLIFSGAVYVDGGSTSQYVPPLRPTRDDCATGFGPGRVVMATDLFRRLGGYAPRLEFGENTELAVRALSLGDVQDVEVIPRAFVRINRRPLDAPELDEPRLAAASYTLGAHWDKADLFPRLFASYHTLLGTAAARDGSWRLARRHFRRALTCWPRNPRGWTRLAVSMVPVLNKRVPAWRPSPPGGSGPPRPRHRGRVLLVSHEATRSGAPRVALDVLWSMNMLRMEPRALVRWGGPLLPEFRARTVSTRLEPLRHLRVTLRRSRATRTGAIRLEQALASILTRLYRPDLVYLNTVLAAPYLRPAVRMGVPVVLHCHEMTAHMRSAFERYGLTPDEIGAATLVACSPSVQAGLAGILGCEPDRIRTLRSVPDGLRVRALGARPRAPVCRRGMVVGACGAAGPGKGVDRWLALAALVAEAGVGEAKFRWVGRRPPAAIVESTTIPPNVEFLGELANPYDAMSDFDVFTLTSRSDSFPLVVLEAMLLEIPVVAFDVGSVAEQIGEAGIVVPQGRVDLMAREVARLLGDPAERRKRGRAGLERVVERYPYEDFADHIGQIIAARFDGRPP